MTFPAGQLTEKFQEKTYLGFEGTRDQVMNALSKQGNESIIQTNVGDASSTPSEREKKKKDAERANLAMALEQQRGIMLGQLNKGIGKLTEQIEKDQAQLEILRTKKSAITSADRLNRNDQWERNNPDHKEILNKIEIQNTNAFFDGSKEDRQNKIDSKRGQVDNKISELVEKIEANMNKLDILVQAKEDLKNGVDPREVQKSLDDKGIVLKDVSKNGVILSLDDIIESYKDNQEKLDFDIEDLSDTEQAEFYSKAQDSGNFTSQELESYKEIMTVEAKAMIESQYAKIEVTIPNNSM
ncbi:MAG: hypothetical protein DHS20C07_16930 [Methyloligella sp.]|nr:MAG: hypothetical protein DHS20C07_16930 [Methyloligella sp.]